MASVNVENLSVVYPVSLQVTSLRSALSGLIRRSSRQDSDNAPGNITALHDIDLSLKTGDRLGLIGHNGAGKSTLLRTLGGIFTPTKGKVRVQGTMQTLLTLGSGFDPEESGWDNVAFFCAFHGLSANESQRVRKDVEDFSELGEFLNYPIRSYSSGMQTRLAFTLATTLSPQILLLDEIIGAGDASFFKKAQARMQSMAISTEILVLASHSDDLIQRWCNKALWLEKGRILALGDVDTVVRKYQDSIA